MMACAVIRGRNAAEAATAGLLARKEGAGLVEHRLDFLERALGEAELRALYGKIGLPVVATCRRAGPGNRFSGGEGERASFLVSAINAGAGMVDVELEAGKRFREKVVAAARAKGCKVIVSAHDFSGTPSKEKLVGLLEAEKAAGADIGKVVATANSRADCGRVLSLYAHAEKSGFPLIAFAMGVKGRESRVGALLCGAPFMYASAGRGGSVAPGQLSVGALRNAVARKRR